MNDKISHPVHYTQGIECWDYITSHKMGYLEGNIIKYVTRYKYKDGLDDLFKAKAYLQRLIEEQFGPPLVVEGVPVTGSLIPGGSPISGPLKDVKRLNGAVPLGPVNVDEDWLPAACAIPFGIGDIDGACTFLPKEVFLGPLLDGRNCPADCGCPGHLEDMVAHGKHVWDLDAFLAYLERGTPPWKYDADWSRLGGRADGD